MRRLYLLAIAFILIPQLIFAQLEVDISKKAFKNKQTGFREAWFHVKEGNKLTNKGKGMYKKALDEYLQAYSYNSQCAELNYKIGALYLQTDKKRNALDYLVKANQTNSKLNYNIHLLLAKTYHFNLDFDNAIKEYEAYVHYLSNHDKKKVGPTILKYKEECLNGKDLVANPKRVILKNLGEAVNSIYDDYNPVLSHGDSLMFFISRRPRSISIQPSILDARFDEDIYTARRDTNTWKDASRWNVKFNNKHHNGVVWVSADGKKLFLYNGYKHGGNIQYSDLKKGKWTKPKKLRGGINTDTKESSFTMTQDGNEAYFVSDDDRESFGGKDIFYTFKNKRGKWTSPKNVGSSINTMYDEEGVCVSPDGKTLYFSSKGHNNIGGYDIFKSQKNEKNEWSKPENLGYPLNTPDDELFFKPSVNPKQGYFSTVREDTYGGKDIYRVVFLGAEKEMIALTDDQLISYPANPFPDIFIRQPQELSVDTSVTLKGLILDVKTNTPLQAKINLIDLEKSQVINTTITDATGSYQFSLPSVKNYGVEINAKDYMFLLDVINMPPHITSREINKNFGLTKLEVGVKVVLKNIYFETGKATLKSESFAELDKVLKFLQDNSELKIEISGHTDNVGAVKANTSLSEARAKSVVEYLTGHGIPASQLTYKGYGLSQPIASNKTAAGRKMNRRVEFKIVSKE